MEARGFLAALSRLAPVAGGPALILLAALALPGCPPADPPLHVEVDPACENLVPGHCLLPWPSDRWLVPDDATETGLRLAYESESFPISLETDEVFVPDAWNRLDGFSPASQLLATFDGALDVSALPPSTDYGASLAAGSPTVIVDAETGERVAHFAEVDARAEDPAAALLYLRPAARLREGTRYLVALRDLRFTDGTAVEPSPVFRALRDGVLTDAPLVEARRPGFETLFQGLTAAGVERADLVLAWSFTTASGELLRGDLLAMRDDALERVGPEGLGCTVTSVEEPYQDVLRRIDGTFTVPWYLDAGGDRVSRGPDGRPLANGTREVDFVAILPANAEPGATPMITYGHGLMGRDTEAVGGAPRTIANALGMGIGATRWAGMSFPDATDVVNGLTDVGRFPVVADRLQQGMVNQLVFTRTLAGACAADPAFAVGGASVVDPDRRYFFGISQGGIFGATVLALSTDIERGVLNVGAAFYPVMIERSVDFETYEFFYAMGYPARMDRQVLLAILQQLWDYTDPATWLPHLVADPLPGTSAKKVLYTVAKNDAQVPNLASDMAVRTAGIPLVTPALHPVWGVAERAAPYDGSGYVYYDTGDPAGPTGNTPPAEDAGGHGAVRKVPAHIEQMKAFLKPGGLIEHTCDGPCDPE